MMKRILFLLGLLVACIPIYTQSWTNKQADDILSELYKRQLLSVEGLEGMRVLLYEDRSRPTPDFERLGDKITAKFFLQNLQFAVEQATYFRQGGFHTVSQMANMSSQPMPTDATEAQQMADEWQAAFSALPQLQIESGIPYEPTYVRPQVGSGLSIVDGQGNLIPDPDNEHVAYWWSLDRSVLGKTIHRTIEDLYALGVITETDRNTVENKRKAGEIATEYELLGLLLELLEK